MPETTPSFAEMLEEGFADRLEQAIAAAETRGVKVTNKLLAEQLQDLGIDVTESHLSHLRQGRRDRPSAWLVAGLATILDVPISHFAPEDPRSQEDSAITALQSLGDPGHVLLWSAVGISQPSFELCLALLAHMREQEGLPPVRRSKRNKP